MPMATEKLPPIADRLRKLRDAAGMTQQALAVKAEMSVGNVAQIEQGAISDPRISTLVKLAKALGVGVEELIAE